MDIQVKQESRRVSTITMLLTDEGLQELYDSLYEAGGRDDSLKAPLAQLFEEVFNLLDNKAGGKYEPIFHIETNPNLYTEEQARRIRRALKRHYSYVDRPNPATDFDW